jgi:SAM-dependent methyltransferase
MLGASLDYRLLRSLAHSRHRYSEEELDARRSSSLNAGQETTKLGKILRRFEGRFPLDPTLRYLDMGCGSGEVTLGLAALGLDVTGVDVLPRFIASARANAQASVYQDRVTFHCADLRYWTPPVKYDVLLSFDALEHIAEPRAFMARMADFLAPGGIAVLEFGPLFHSPFGDHMYDFFEVQIPWRGILFSEEAMLRVRRECYRPTDGATSYGEIAGGLNLMRYSEYMRYAKETGWRFRYLRTNAFLQGGPLRWLSDTLCRTPVIRDYVVHNVYAIMERVEQGRMECLTTSTNRSSSPARRNPRSRRQ